MFCVGVVQGTAWLGEPYEGRRRCVINRSELAADLLFNIQTAVRKKLCGMPNKTKTLAPKQLMFKKEWK